MFRFFIFLSAMFFIFTACKKEQLKTDESYRLDLPWGFPHPDVPAGNALTQKRIQLGEMLFFDKALSRDSSVACVTCHLPEKAFTDRLPKSVGIHGRLSLRNSPTLFNVAYRTSFFKDGGVPTLELQALAPISDSAEMDFSMPELVERLKKNETYNRLSMEAYNRPIDPFVITRALSAFQRTLIAGNSRYDQYLQTSNEQLLTEKEKAGMLLFFGNHANCGSCHGGFLLTNQAFLNNGLYLNYADVGRMRITLNPEDEGKFVVPSLRDVSRTAPYMHDGSLETLEDVLAHYNQGGTGHPNQDERVRPLGLTTDEKSALVAFLKTLDSDFAFTHHQ